ncbi:RHS repeat-associated core domain-containing protein [Micromonospora sp. NPDC051006]|uniref:RHS repeat-associated core domain-containing protein n=1 Tax=Micromonospora sp. NPDC051006 TaxID=3364283 RepID=UPI00378F1C02
MPRRGAGSLCRPGQTCASGKAGRHRVGVVRADAEPAPHVGRTLASYLGDMRASCLVVPDNVTMPGSDLRRAARRRRAGGCAVVKGVGAVGVAQAAAVPGVRASQLLLGGDVADVVNMFRGEVNLPVDLLSLTGRGGLDVTVTAFYGSGVHESVERSNLTVPTGVLGVGWSLPYERIVVESQTSGTTVDDVYYLISGGAARRLVPVGVDGRARLFQLLDQPFWQITYHPDPISPESECWSVVREDGSTYTYGLSAIQRGVRWGNWIGPSTLAGGVSFPVAWNLLRIRSLAGDIVSFAYEVDDVLIGPTVQARSTRSCRLRQITDVFGQTVEFCYLPKEPCETPPAHVPPPGAGNAYQFHVEDHYLDRVVVRDTAGGTILTTWLRYVLRNVSRHPNDNQYLKRYLVAVGQEVAGGGVLPELEFDYHGPDNPNPGALQTARTPLGGRSTYEYRAEELPNTALRVAITRPAAGGTPRIWHGPGYTVVTWQNSDTGQVTTDVYSWNGSWVGQQETRGWAASPGTLRVLTTDGFFAIWYRDARSAEYRVHLIRAEQFRFGEWGRDTYPITLDRPMTEPEVSLGGGFVAVADAAAGQLKIVSWDLVERRWVEHGFELGAVMRVALAAGPNHCVVAIYTGSSRTLSVMIYHGDDEGRWRRADTVSETVDVDWSATRSDGLLATGASFAVLGFVAALDRTSGTVRYATRLLTWSTAYRFGQVLKADGSQPLDALNPVGYAAVNGSTAANGEHLFRFDGSRWQQVTAVRPTVGPRYSYRYAADIAYAITAPNAGPWSAELFEYDPYRNTWATPTRVTGSSPGLPTLAEGYRTVGRELLWRTPEGAWLTVYTLPAEADLTTLTNAAPSYLTYQERSGATHLVTLVDAAVRDSVTLPGERVVVPDPQPGQILTGPDTIVTYRGPDFDGATSLALYRVVGGRTATRLVAYPVVRVGTDSGYQTQHTTLGYDLGTATYDPYGLVTQFVTVRATPGDGGEGCVERVFFNGLSPRVPGVVYPVSDEYSNARAYFSALNGQLYRTRGFDADGRQVSESVTFPYTWPGRDTDRRIAGAYTRVRKQTQALSGELFTSDVDGTDLSREAMPRALSAAFAAHGLPLAEPVTVAEDRPGPRWRLTDAAGAEYQVHADGTRLTVYGWLTDTTEYEYNEHGQLCRELGENIDDQGVRRRLRGDTVYAWQTYPGLRERNCLVPISQVTAVDVTADVVTASEVTTYSEAWGPWAAARSYQWLGVNEPTFPGWASEADPGPGWLCARQVVDVTERAQPLTALDASGHIAAAIYDREHRFGVATTANADPRAGEACWYGFEEYEDDSGWTLVPADADPGDYITEGPAHSGSRRLAVPGDPDCAIGITNEFTPARGDRPYQLTCWVCTQPGFVSDPDLSAWRTVVRDEQGDTAEVVVPIPATDGRWRWLHQLIDSRELGLGAIASVAPTLTSRQDRRWLLVDDIAFAPVSASLRASVYSPDGQELRATVDMLGGTRRVGYDLLSRPVVDVGLDEQPLSVTVEHFWRCRQGTFDPTRPNATLAAALRGSGSFTDFRQGEQWRTHWCADAGWKQQPGLLCHDGDDTARLTLAETPKGSYLLRLALAANPPARQALRVAAGQWCIRWSDGCWTLRQATDEPVVSAAGAAGTDLLLIVWPHRLLWYVDGDLVLQHVDSGGFAGPVAFATDGPLALRWIAFGADPVVAITFSDNAGRPRQLHRVDDTRVRASASGYDAAGRPAVATKAVEVTGEPIGYRPDLTTELDPDSGAMGVCELTRAYPADDGYPFSRTLFESSPLGRPVESGRPGRAFAVVESTPVGQRHTARTDYRVNTRQPLLTNLPAGQYPLEVSTDPDGRVTRIWRDRLNRVVAAAQGDLAGEPGAFTLVRNYYDAYGNLVRRDQPNLTDTTVPDRERFTERTEYDFVGNPVSITAPDLEGSVEHVYDTLGRLRFSQGPQAATDGYLCYRRYDALSRLTEQGTCDTAWNRDELQSHADDAAWLPAAGIWLTRFRYDGDGTDPLVYGRLWQTLTGPAVDDDTPLTRSTYAYDRRGLVTSRTTRVSAYNDSEPHTLAFEHDTTGALTAITYDAQLDADAFTARLTADGFTDLVNVAGEHRGSRTELARFRYTPDGALATEMLAPGGSAELTRTYRYAPPGWLASVEDRYLTETTDYTSGGYDGGGYHDGRATRLATRFTGVNQDGFLPDVTVRYRYDPLGRLAVAECSAGPAFGMSGLTYDANGNVTARVDAGRSQRLCYQDGTNRLRTAEAGDQGPFGYDRDGNVTAAPLIDVPELRYDPCSRLPTGLTGAAGQLDLTRGADGTLLLRKGSDARLLSVPGAGAAPLALHHTDGSGAHRVGYLIPGPGGSVGVWSPQGITYVLRGRLGSTRALYDGSGLIGAFNYLPNGGFLGTPVDRGASAVYPYLFAGAERDPGSGLYLFPQRLYDPDTGRFLSVDPAGQYPSPYLYAGGDPINGFDPSGGFAFSWPAFGAVLGGVAAAIGGIALTVLTAGAAWPVMVGATLAGGLLIGGGLASAAYGLGHANAEGPAFDKTEWGISVGLGAAFGLAAAGLGFASAAVTTSVVASLGIETFIGAGLGALDGFISNGVLNQQQGRDFDAGAGLAAGLGALGGAIAGGIGGGLGRGPMLRTNLTLRAGRQAQTAGQASRAYVITYDQGSIWHAQIGTRAQGAATTRVTDLQANLRNVKETFRGGQETNVVTREMNWVPASSNEVIPRYVRGIDLPAENVAAAERFAQRSAEADPGRFSVFTNNCTTYAADVLRAADIHPPMWVRSPSGLRLWAVTIGQRL